MTKDILGEMHHIMICGQSGESKSITPTNETHVWYCAGCRKTGLLHCSDPEYCGGMMFVPRTSITHQDIDS